MADNEQLDWDDLRYFLAAVRGKTLAGAARALGVEHTTVGRRISALERALGGALLLRGPDGLRLTALGLRLAPRIEELEASIVSLRALVKSEAARVRLTLPSGLTRYFTAELATFQESHPGIALELLSGATTLDLSAGEADLAVRSGPMRGEELMTRKVGSAGFSLYAAPKYLARCGAPPDLSSLAGHAIIGFHAALSSMPAARWLSERSEGATIVLRSREMVDMLTATLDGVGLALLPCSLADPESGLCRLTPEVLATHPLFLVHRREARLSEEVRAVTRFVVDVMKKNAGRIGGTNSGMLSAHIAHEQERPRT